MNLRQGIGLVLTGPQGCGKSRKAREIAEKHGPYAEVGESDLSSDNFIKCLESGARTFIIDGVIREPKAAIAIKTMLSQPKIGVYVGSEQPMMLDSPFIIITCQTDDAEEFSDNRRFHVVRM